MAGLKTSTIKKLFRAKIDGIVDTILDEEVRELFKRDVIITGGAIASCLLGEKINDYDMYFATKETTLAVAKYYVDKFNELNGTKANPNGSSRTPQVKEVKRTNCAGFLEDRIVIWVKSAGVAGEGETVDYQYFESKPEKDADKFIDQFSADDKEFGADHFADPVDAVVKTSNVVKEAIKHKLFRPVFMSENAITLSNKVQLVIRFWGEPSELHNNYDYVHAMGSYRYNADELIIPPEAMEALLSRTLIYRGSLYPVASIFRLRKFYERGFRITAGQMLKIIHQVSKLDLSNPKVLREQLVGVDQAYMHQLMRRLEQVEGEVDATYLARLIDEIFE